jgi:hypothetical protein
MFDVLFQKTIIISISFDPETSPASWGTPLGKPPRSTVRVKGVRFSNMKGTKRTTPCKIAGALSQGRFSQRDDSAGGSRIISLKKKVMLSGNKSMNLKLVFILGCPKDVYLVVEPYPPEK